MIGVGDPKGHKPEGPDSDDEDEGAGVIVDELVDAIKSEDWDGVKQGLLALKKC